MAEFFKSVNDVRNWLRDKERPSGIKIREINVDGWKPPLICLDDVLGILWSDKTTRVAQLGANVMCALLDAKIIKLHWPNTPEEPSYLAMAHPYHCIEIILRFPLCYAGNPIAIIQHGNLCQFVAKFSPQMKAAIRKTWLKGHYEMPDC